MVTEAFSVRTAKETLERLDELARQMDRSRNYVVNQAIDQLLALHAWQDERTREGLEAADKGDFVDDAEIQRIVNKHRSK